MKAVKIITFLLLFFNGMGALFGGYMLMSDPSGSSLYLSPEYLNNTRFIDYFLPGLVLFLANGLGSMLVLLGIRLGWKIAPLLVILQGFVLVSWIVIQVALIDIIYYLHYVMGGIGICLIICGILLEKNKS